jgi:multidrug resistance efflux pump
MAPVRAGHAAAGALATAVLAEAAGWVEPDPFPTAVRPLVSGRVESLEVREGDVVQAGVTVLARLRSAALEAAAERAGALVAERERARDAAAAAHAVRAAMLAQCAAPRLAKLDAEERAAERQARLAAARGTVRRTRAEAAGAAAAAAAQDELAAAGASNTIARTRAAAAAAAAAALAEAAVQELAAVEADHAAAAARVVLATALLTEPVELQGAVTTAAAALAEAEAALASARTEQAIADRELRWTTVVAPQDGVVLRLGVGPGAAAGHDGDPLLWLYDPARMRARIDVPLAAVGAVDVGQTVLVRSEVLGDAVVHGIVQRVQRESDLLKNTLQVKVQLLEPPLLLRPETLCRARFLAPPPTGDDAGATAPRTFLLPRSAVRDGTVFRFDPSARCARAVAVTVLQEQGDEVLVTGELSPTHRVILTTVHDGESVQEATR